MMELDFDDSALRGLRRYILLVSRAIGLRGEGSHAEVGERASAYIPLDRRLSRFPGRDVALLWDDNHGWAAGVENPSDDNLLVVAYLGQELLPPPESVATWARTLFVEHTADGPELPDLSGTANVGRRLAAYASVPEFGTAANHNR